MNGKKTPKVGDLVMLNRHYNDHGRLAIVTKLLPGFTTEVFIAFIDTCEEMYTYTSSLEILNESR